LLGLNTVTKQNTVTPHCPTQHNVDAHNSRVPPAYGDGSWPGHHHGHPNLRLGGAHSDHHHPANATEGYHMD